MSVRHMLDAWPDPSAHCEGVGRIGTRELSPLPDEFDPFHVAIGMLRLDGVCKPNEAHLRSLRLGNECGVPKLGEQIFGLFGDEEISGVISAFAGMIWLRDVRTGQRSLLTDFIEVCFTWPSAGDLFMPGQGGTLVLDHRRRPLGLLVAGSPSCAYIAPLADYMKAHGMSLWSALPAELSEWLGQVLALSESLTAFPSGFSRVDVGPPPGLASLELSRELAAE